MITTTWNGNISLDISMVSYSNFDGANYEYSESLTSKIRYSVKSIVLLLTSSIIYRQMIHTFRKIINRRNIRNNLNFVFSILIFFYRFSRILILGHEIIDKFD